MPGEEGVGRGRALGHYRIVEKVGAGGMGEVFLARDEHLDRDVAVKVLPPGALADQTGRKRFRKEALSLSRLSHPNIATVFDFDTQDELDYLVMEYVAGQALRERLSFGPMSEDEIARLGPQIAEGLAAAHAQGIVHRDLKPENLRIAADGRLKILDFGLAKWIAPVSAGTVTETLGEMRTVTGTLPYMAPEQLQGKPIDARTDIYAAGVVLYEMATGRPPFREQLSTALADAILHREPPAPGRLVPDIAPRLEEIILKCLEKEPADRYQSAHDLLIDLRRLSAPAAVPARRRRRWPMAPLAAGAAAVILLAVASALLIVRWRTSPGAPEIRSLAVLPLDNLSRDPEQEYFADGMTEALIADLSQIGTLRVISRTSVLRYRGAKRPLPEIARELGVDALIEGSVMRAGDRVRIAAQLVAANPERQLWANSYDRELRDILELHSDVARAIAAEIRVKLTPEERARLSAARPVVPEALEAYLRGRFHATRFTPEPLQIARQYLEEAVRRDPTFAPAWAELAHVYIKMSGSVTTARSPVTRMDLLVQALSAARKGLEIDPDSASSHMMAAIAGVYIDRDLPAAMKEMNRARELGPKDADVLIHAAVFLALTGKKDAAVAAARRALELEPVNYEINQLAGLVFNGVGDHEGAIAQYRKALELDASSSGVYELLSRAYEFEGRYPEAVAARQKALTLSGAEPTRGEALARAFASQGMRGAYLWELEMVRSATPDGSGFPTQQAALHAVLGESNRAFELLESAYRQRDEDLLGLRFNRRFDGLHSDPRFQDLVRRVFRED